MATIMMHVLGVKGQSDRRLRAKIANLKNPEHLEKLGRHVAESMASAAPVQSGLLTRTLKSSVTGVQTYGNRAWIGVGAYSDVGKPTRKAPRGTIKAFLRANPQHKLGTKLSAGYMFDPRYAWWYLTLQARMELDAARDAGLYGGAVGGKIIPAYWYLQESGTYPSPYGGVPKDFVKGTLALIEGAARSTYSFVANP